MAIPDALRIGISCFPSVGGSGTLATALGQDLAARGHDVHFICYERPFRLLAEGPRLHFHPVIVNDYDVLKFPDYTLPLSVRMAEVSRDHRLDLLHVHYAVPHATAAILARSMLPPEGQPRSGPRPSACSTSPAPSRSSTTSSCPGHRAALPRRCAASSAWMVKSSSCIPPTSARENASISCWRR